MHIVEVTAAALAPLKQLLHRPGRVHEDGIGRDTPHSSRTQRGLQSARGFDQGSRSQRWHAKKVAAVYSHAADLVDKIYHITKSVLNERYELVCVCAIPVYVHFCREDGLVPLNGSDSAAQCLELMPLHIQVPEPDRFACEEG
jgi:hypothetical protein